VAIFRFSNAGGFGTYQRYNDFLAGNPAVVQDAGAMFPLGEFTLAEIGRAVEFTNIPQTYTHLQIRFTARTVSANTENGSLLCYFTLYQLHLDDDCYNVSIMPKGIRIYGSR
jgi:hypothetical protein